jgi:hypothetical protein
MTMRVTERPQVLKGASAGTPWPVARDYSAPGPTVAAWVLSNDASAATSGMFTAMQPTPQRNDYYIVPMVKDGRSVCEFEISRDDRGRWEAVGGLSDPLPGGTVLDAESATRQLREELGTAAEVRFVVFLPSGLIFAVGCNGEREAAVYLTFNNAGPGITTFDKYLPRTGRLFSPDELARLLAP